MVKPAMPYLDILAEAQRIAPNHPLACFQVSGEYAMIVAGARAGVYDLKTMAFEALDGAIRAGMSGIYAHHKSELTRWRYSRCYTHRVIFYATIPRLAR
jgi:porphobilinogen synthase